MWTKIKSFKVNVYIDIKQTDDKARQLNKSKSFMDDALKTWNHTKFIIYDLSIQCRSSILLLKHQAIFHNTERTQSSKNKHERHESTVSKFYSTGERKYLVLAPGCYGKENNNGGFGRPMEESLTKL